MNRTTIDRALLWKEVRQVAPLVWTVLLFGLAICLLIVLAETASPTSGKMEVPPIPFLAIPMIFATGVGILLVGNEKDQRTLTWLRSLPIPPGRIAALKFLVAVGSLGFVWLASILLWWIVRSAVGPGVTETKWNWVGEYSSLVLIYPMVSLFLTFSGLAMAWRTSSSLVALLSLVPMSIALWLVSALIAKVANHYQWDLAGQADWDLGGSSPWIYLMVIAAGTLAAFAYGWRASLLHLRPQDGPRQTVFRLGASIADSAAVDSSSLLWPSQPRTSALLWQSAYQSRWIWIGLAAILAFTVWLTVQIPTDFGGGAPASDYIEPVVQIGFVLLLLAVCWLGVFAYQSDNMNERIRFLSDRGVSPNRVWWTRHWIPVLILIGVALIRYVLRPYHSYGSDQLPQVVVYDFFRFLAIGIAIYAASQWIGQSLRSPIIATVVAPLGVLALFIYGVFAHAMFEAPYWLVGSASFLLLVATWFQTKPWMDRAFGWKYYLIHGGFLLTAMILPLLPGIWKLASIPRMPADIRESLSDLARQPLDAKKLAWDGVHSDFGFYSPSQMFMVATAFASNEESRKQRLEDLKSSKGIRVYDWDSLRRNLDFYLSALIASRHAIEIDATPETQANYRRTIEGLLALVKTLRDHERLLWQDGSEVIEIALLGECRNEATRQSMSEPLYRSVVQLLSDNTTRDMCRRRSLARALESGQSSQTKRFATWLGDYYLADNGRGSMVSQAHQRNLPEEVATRLWQLLQKDAGSAEHERREIAQSLQQDSLQSDIVGSLITIARLGYLPGAHWRGAWEREARALPPFNSTSISTNTVGGPNQ